jgi:histidinol dehydrogenase
MNLTRDELAELSPTIEAFGEMEGFPTHAKGATVRFEGD